VLSTVLSEFDEFYPTIPNKQDRTGVMRRQEFVVIERDLRKKDAEGEAVPPQQPAPAGVWQETLAKILQGASLSHYHDGARRTCDALGVAHSSEVWESAAEIADKCGMKPLERRRFLAAASVAASSQRATAAQRETTQQEEDEDPGIWGGGLGMDDE
jgi:hypothetical protein